MTYFVGDGLGEIDTYAVGGKRYIPAGVKGLDAGINVFSHGIGIAERMQILVLCAVFVDDFLR